MPTLSPDPGSVNEGEELMARHHWTYPPSEDSMSAPANDRARRFLAGSEVAVRTHLTIVKGYTQLLERLRRQPDVDPVRFETYTNTLDVEVTRLEQLLNQYFAAARLQWDATAINWHAVELGRLADQVLARFDASLPPGARHNLRVETIDDIQGIWDHHWLGEALAALVSNALAYSTDGSEVQIIVRREDAHALITVSDAGRGVLADETERIFQPFERGSAARDSGAQGWGLGLFVASQAVIAHGGWLEVESEPGIGSRFSLHVPVLPPMAPRHSA